MPVLVESISSSICIEDMECTIVAFENSLALLLSYFVNLLLWEKYNHLNFYFLSLPIEVNFSGQPLYIVPFVGVGMCPF